jgi:hypothetical protein
MLSTLTRAAPMCVKTKPREQYGSICTLGPCSLSHPNPKYFLFHPSHQIFRRMHGALNVGKKEN